MIDSVKREIIKGILQAEKFIIKWKIDQFFADCQKTGDYYRSPVFPINCGNTITEWFLVVYPKGQDEETKDYVSMFLYFKSKNEIEVNVDFELSIMSEENGGSREVQEYTNYTFKNPSDFIWGWKTFVEQSDIKDTFINDTLVILCEITFHATDQDITKSFHGYDELIEKIGNDFSDYERLLESGSFTDVTFNVQDKQIKLHKAILSCRSPVFEAMFSHEMKENVQNSVEITDIDYDAMKELLRFIYSGKVRNIKKIASQLLIAADKYQVIELKALCEETLYGQLTVDNAVEYLKLTELTDTIHLKRLIIKYIGAHHLEVVKKPGFVDLDKNVLYEILLAAAEKN